MLIRNPFKKLSRPGPTRFDSLPVEVLDQVTSFVPLISVASPADLQHLLDNAGGRKVNISIGEDALRGLKPNDYFRIIKERGGVARLKTTLKSGFTGTDVYENEFNFDIEDFDLLFQLQLSALELEYFVKTNEDVKLLLALERNGLKELILQLSDTEGASLNLAKLLSQVSVLRSLHELHLDFEKGENEYSNTSPRQLRSSIQNLTLNTPNYPLSDILPFLGRSADLKSFHLIHHSIDDEQALPILYILSKKPKLRDLHLNFEILHNLPEMTKSLSMFCSRVDKIYLFSTPGAETLFTALSSNTHIKEVKLGHGILNNAASDALGKFLSSTQTLKVLVLDEFLFNADNVEWARGLSVNKTLEELQLNYISFTEEQLHLYNDSKSSGVLEFYNPTDVPFPWEAKRTNRQNHLII